MTSIGYPANGPSFNGAITVGATSTEVLAGNGKRRGAIIVNDSDEIIYLSYGDNAVLNSGIRLNAGGGSLSIDLNNTYTGRVTAICSSGSKVLTVTEW